MNGKSKQFALAIASFAVGAVLAGVLGNDQARTKLVEGSKKYLQKSA
jgi:uncharacterized membrane protein YoaK (UPF0700 family)